MSFCVFCWLCTLLKVVSYYDLSLLSMSVIGFQKKNAGWVGGVTYIQVYFGFLEKKLNFAKPLKPTLELARKSNYGAEI